MTGQEVDDSVGVHVGGAIVGGHVGQDEGGTVGGHVGHVASVQGLQVGVGGQVVAVTIGESVGGGRVGHVIIGDTVEIE